MSKRLQVVMQDAEWRSYRQVAKAQRLTLSEWARQALRKARSAVTEYDVEARLRVIRNAAASTAAPVADIEEMLEETERGYLGESVGGAGR